MHIFSLFECKHNIVEVDFKLVTWLQPVCMLNSISQKYSCGCLLLLFFFLFCSFLFLFLLRMCIHTKRLDLLFMP